MPKIVVYVKAADARALEAAGNDVAKWVRDYVQFQIDRWKEKQQ